MRRTSLTRIRSLIRRSLTLIRLHLSIHTIRLWDHNQAFMSSQTEPKWITLGHPSYVWRFGQDRRLALVRHYVPLEGKSILDVGCGIGTYVRKLRQLGDDVHGVDVEAERVAEASKSMTNRQVAPAGTC